MSKFLDGLWLDVLEVFTTLKMSTLGPQIKALKALNDQATQGLVINIGPGTTCKAFKTSDDRTVALHISGDCAIILPQPNDLQYTLSVEPKERWWEEGVVENWNKGNRQSQPTQREENGK